MVARHCWGIVDSSIINCVFGLKKLNATFQQAAGQGFWSMMKLVEPLDSKNLVKLIANGRLNELCLLCLVPLGETGFESIFTLICKEGAEYCIADALEAVCHFELHRSENYNVCIHCFKSASNAYKFHLQAKYSMEIITHYTQELLNNVNSIEITSEDMEKLLFIPLSEYTPTSRLFDFNLDGIGNMPHSNISIEDNIKIENKDNTLNGNDSSIANYHTDDPGIINKCSNSNESESNSNDENFDCDRKTFYNNSTLYDNSSFCVDTTEDGNDEYDNEGSDPTKNTDDVILVVQKEESSFNDDGSLQSSDDEMLVIVNEKKVRKKRDPMVYMMCSQCPVKYRFVAKLKDHMKTVHDIDLYYCKICKIVTEQKAEYEAHLKSHREKHQCAVCNMVYKKADTLLAHMKTHEKEKQSEQLENVNVCEQCGVILEDEESLEEHMNNKHVKRYTCYYCGRMYRGEGSFEGHIRKHEEYWNRKQGLKTDQSSSKQGDKQTCKLNKSKRSVCQTCGKDFVDERSLLWHQRLHSNDRPFICDVCGRGFVSNNRRNQHSLCAHTPPQRRCPLCPALFHLRSMVNTHVKKVHLKAHKRRNRTSKHQNVYWRTQAVPIQELSIDVQNDVMELKAAHDDKLPEPAKYSATGSLFV